MTPTGVGRFGGWTRAVPPLPMIIEPKTLVTDPTELYSGKEVAMIVGV